MRKVASRLANIILILYGGPNIFIFLQTSVNMENVVACELLEEKSNGKAQFRIVYFSQNAREFKHYDFETEANVSGEDLSPFHHPWSPLVLLIFTLALS